MLGGPTPNVAELLVALPTELVAIHLNTLLLSNPEVEGVVYDALVAPLIFAKVIPPSILFCH